MADFHECKHEVDLALQCKMLENIEKGVKDLCEAIQGKGDSQGLKTKVELNSAAIKRMYLIMTPVGLTLIGLAVKAFI